MQGAPKPIHCLWWFPGTNFVLKLVAVKEGNKLLLFTFTFSRKKTLHLKAGNSTTYLYNLKILFHLGKIMLF